MIAQFVHVTEEQQLTSKSGHPLTQIKVEERSVPSFDSISSCDRFLFILSSSLTLNINLSHADYFPLGHFATTSGTSPTETAMMVLDNGDGFVAPPQSMT